MQRIDIDQKTAVPAFVRIEKPLFLRPGDFRQSHTVRKYFERGHRTNGRGDGGQNLWPFLIYALSVAALLGAVLVLSWLISSKSRHTEATDLPFESGVLPVGKAEETRMSIEFYLIAMFFVIFDLETIFIIAWAVAFFELGWQGYIGASLFIVILLVALVYELRTGALDWGALRRRERGGYAVARATVESQ